MKEEKIKIILGALLIVTLIVSLVINNGVTKYSKEFKNEYEKINGEKNSLGKEHRKVKISANNPFQKVDASEIVKKIENKETFYVYFGDKLCPWCRSVIEKAVEVANKKHIRKIYYVAIWDDNGNEILRDTWTAKDKIATKEKNGTKEYYSLLKYFDNVLEDGTVKDEWSTDVLTGEKRIYAPNFIYVKNGKAIKMVDGISKRQTDSREKLTKEILEDEEKIFNNFFKN